MWSLLLALLPAAAALRGGKGFRDRPDLADKYGVVTPEALFAEAPVFAALNHSHTNTTTPHRYRSNTTEPFYVHSLPEVDWDIGELYSGLIPLDQNASEGLFFVFKPRDGPAVDELTIWLNGGPGCSSLMGWMQEVGPVLWQPGQIRPSKNPYSWDKETNMLWVEQPVGTGFSIGTPTARGEEDIAEDFLKFFKTFQEKFGIKNYKVYVTGESYAGRYVPYISAAMVDANNTEHFDVAGALVYDPCIGDYQFVQQEFTAYPHVAQNNNLWRLNATYLAQLESLHKQCGYADFIDKYLRFPAAGQQPSLGDSVGPDDLNCDIWGAALEGANAVNPCFNLYEIVDHCPTPWDPLTEPGPHGEAYFRRKDVLEAIHAPTSVQWKECGVSRVFPQGDNSLDSIQHALPKVIEHTNRVLVSNAEWDYIIITNGTLLSIQNMTWNGALGFESAPTEDFYVDLPDATADPGDSDNQGTMGVKHFERGLMWVETFQSGHEQPEYQPRAALKHLRWLLGRIPDL